MDAKEIQKRERIMSVKIIQVAIPRGREYEIREHARKYDSQQGGLDRFILRAIDLCIRHDKDIEKEMDDAKNKYYKGY